jgi:very-short-patch-repair endonuclease
MNTAIPFEKSFASCEKSKYWSSNNELKPEQVYKVSAKKYYFDCDKCDHMFYMSLSHISGRNSWCPYCCNKKLCGSKDCIPCFEKSFASHEKSLFWSDKNELKPEFVLKKGDKKIWFNCDKCNHDFETQIKAVTIRNHWCPYCVNQKLCDNNDCKKCFEKSFASHENAKFWSSKNEISPRQIVQGSGKKCWFNCNKCCHEFIKDIHAITGSKNGWCAYCENKKMCDNDDCKECFNKSFASHEKVKFWSIKNTKNPRHLFQGDSDKYLFNCNKCNLDFESVLYNVKSGYWCPFCVNKTETKFYKILKELFPSIIYQFKVEWCKNKMHLPFDFCIPEYKIIIELDGPQHFTQIMEWKTPEEQFKRDKYKEQCANENNYSVIRIIQSDVFNDTYNWLKELCETIEELKNGDEIANIYLCKNKEYDLF